MYSFSNNHAINDNINIFQQTSPRSLSNGIGLKRKHHLSQRHLRSEELGPRMLTQKVEPSLDNKTEVDS